MNPKASISMSTSSVESFQRRASQKRLMHSDSSVSYQVSLPPSFREDSIKEIITRSVAYMNDDSLDTNTSRSFMHGFILVTIMISSLAAFICGKVHRCSSYTDLSNYEDCVRYFTFHSVMTITSCLVTFLIYFLHLIAQCDIFCLSRKKHEFEIITIFVICSLLLLSSLCYLGHTDVFEESFTLASLVLSAISVLLYLLRIFILAYEMVSQRRKRHQKGSKNVRKLVLTRRSISKDQNSILDAESVLPSPGTCQVISYVRNAPRKKTLSTSVSDDLDDDVFIQ